MKKLLLLLVSVLAALTAISQPILSENFDSSTFPSSGWVVAGTSSFNWNSSNTQSHSGTLSAYHKYQYAGNGYLITPQMALSENSQLSFYVAADFPTFASSTVFTVEVSTTGTNLSDFTPIHTVTAPTPGNTFNLVEIDLSAYTGQSIYIAFHIVDNDGTGYYVDDVLVEPIPTCVKPQNLTFATSTTNTATISWDAISNAQTFIVEYLPFGETDWSIAESQTTNTNTIVLENLQSGMGYTARVKADCGDSDGESPWSNSVLFNTECEIIEQLPYNCNFENVLSVGSSPLPVCWQRVGATTNPYVNNYNSYSESNVLLWMQNPSDVIAVLPAVNNETYPFNTLQVSFYGRNYNGNSKVEVGIITDLSDASTFIPVYTANLVNNYKKYDVSFAEVTLQSGYIALKAINNGDYVYIDDIVVDEIPNCSQPSSLSANIDDDGVKLSWNSTGSVFNIYYREDSELEYTEIYDVSLNNQGFYLLENLNSSSIYHWYVGAVCGDSIIESSVEIFMTECEPITQLPKVWDFEKGNVGSPYPLPYCWTRQAGVASPYVYNEGSGKVLEFLNYDYDNPGSTKYVALPAVDVAANPMNTLQVSFLAYNDNANGTLQVGLMTDPTDESTFTIVETIDSIGQQQTMYEVDFQEYENHGSYIALRSVPTSEDDYSTTFLDDVTIELIPGCQRPTNLTATYITYDSAILTWTSDASLFNLYYRYDNEDYEIIENVTLGESGYVLENLYSGRNYEWFVEALCDDQTTIASAKSNFNTECTEIYSDELPYTMDFESVDANSLPLCWVPVETYTNYNGLTFPTVYSSSVYAYSGQKSLALSAYTNYGETNLIALPKVGMDIHDLRVSFFMKPAYNGMTYGSVKIGLMSDINDINTLEVVETVSAADLENTEYVKYIVSFESTLLEGNDNHIVFLCDATSGGRWYVDDLKIEQIPDCGEPNNLVASEITQNSAKLSWTGSMEMCRIFYKPNYASEYDSIDVYLEDDYFLLEDLEPKTIYNWYVKVECEDEVYVSTVNTFTTPCQYVSELPLTWTFEENNTSGTTANPLPQCWMRVNGNNPYVYNSENSAYQGTKMLYWDYSQSGTATLPPIDKDLYPINSLYMSFMARSQYSTPSSLIIGVMTDPSNQDTFEPVYTITPTNQYTAYVVPFNSYQGEGIYIAIKYDNLENNLYIDSLFLNQMSDCSQPIELSSMIYPTSAQLSWVSTAENFILYFKEASATEYIETYVNLDDNGVYVLEGLNPSTTYNWYVAADCEDQLINSVVETFTTYCMPIQTDSLPYIVDFENNYQQSVPDCWVIVESYQEGYETFPAVSFTPAYSHGGDKSFNLKPHLNSGHANIFALPNFDAEIQDLSLEFYLRPMNNSDIYGRVEVGLMSNLDDNSTFELLQTINATDYDVANYQKFTISFENAQLQGSNNFIVFRCYNSFGLSWYLDDVVVDFVPSCMSPEDLQVVSVGQTDAVLSWTADAELYKLYYKKSTDLDYTVVEVVLDEDGTYYLENLEVASKYSWYVVSVCSEEEESSVSTEKIFSTDCYPIASLPHTWNFESNNIGGTNIAPLPVCWNRISQNQYPLVYEAVENPYLFFDLNYSNSYAVLQRIDIDSINLQDVILSLNAQSLMGYGNASLEIGVMTNPQEASTFTNVATINSFTTTPQDFEISFENYSGTGEYIAIKTLSNAPNYGDIVYIFELSLLEKPDCNSVSNLSLTNVTINSLEINWEGVSESGFTVEYKLNNDDVWSSAGITQNNNFTINNLLSGTKYDVRVAPVCDGLVMYRTITVMTICDVVVTFPYKESFESGDLGCWNNEIVTGTKEWDLYHTQYSTGNVSDGHYSATFPYNSGASARLVSPTFDLSNLENPTLRYDYYAYSYNNSFDSMGVYYRISPSDNWIYLTSHTDNNSNGGFGTYTIQLPQPSSTYQIMFLGAGLNAGGIYLDNINVLNFVPEPECELPTDLVVTNMTQTSATATWSAGGAETSWKLQCKLATSTSWGNEITVNDNPIYQIQGLTPNAFYHVRVKAVCADDLESEWTEAASFTTFEELQSCDKPTNIQSTTSSDHSITIVWTDNAGANKWNVRWKAENETAYTTQEVVGEPTYVIEGLQEATTYQIQVQAVCDNTTSDWSDMISESTGINNIVNSVALYPNPASDYVEVRISDNDVNVSRFEVYDVYGKLISEVEVVENPTRINVATLSSGIYFVKVITDNGVATKNFIRR